MTRSVASLSVFHHTPCPDTTRSSPYSLHPSPGIRIFLFRLETRTTLRLIFSNISFSPLVTAHPLVFWWLPAPVVSILLLLPSFLLLRESPIPPQELIHLYRHSPHPRPLSPSLSVILSIFLHLWHHPFLRSPLSLSLFLRPAHLPFP